MAESSSSLLVDPNHSSLLEVEMLQDYSVCKFGSLDCGEHKKSRKHGLYLVDSLTATGYVSNHFRNIGLRGGVSMSEKQLIENQTL